MTEKLKIENYIINDTYIISVHGEIDLYSINILKIAFDDFIKTNRCKLIIDLSNTNYLDSSGLSALLTLNKTLKAKNCTMGIVVSNAKQSIARIFEITRIDMILKVYDSLEKAVNVMSQPPSPIIKADATI